MDERFLMEIVIGVFGGLIVIALANWREHKELHSKIDKVHHSMRDRLDKIWSHMKRPDD